MARVYVLTTSVGKRKFTERFKRVSSVDKYLAGAKLFAKRNKTDQKATIRIQTKDTGKKSTKGIVKRLN